MTLAGLDDYLTREPDRDYCTNTARCNCPDCDLAADLDHTAELDGRAKLLALFDACAEVSSTLTVHESEMPGAEDTFMTWASSRHLRIAAAPLQSRELRWRSLSVELRGAGRISVLVRLPDAQAEEIK